MFAMLSDTREKIARLISPQRRDRCPLPAGIGMAARAAARAGDIVLVSDKEFPANVTSLDAAGRSRGW
jgi:selenocysteine lyase/cysteine desulfurase